MQLGQAKISFRYYHCDENIKQVAGKLGLPQTKIREVIKFDRLVPELKKLVRNGDVKLESGGQGLDQVRTRQGWHLIKRMSTRRSASRRQ